MQHVQYICSNIRDSLLGKEQNARVSRENTIALYSHIMVQGINREMIFEKEYYKIMYMKYLKEESEKWNIHILVYAVMNNHAHFLVHYQDIKDISKMMNVVNSKFAKLYNRDNERVGYVFRDRFKSVQISNLKQLYNTIAYIHYNPVKAKIVKNLEDYQYSSYQQFISNKKTKEEIYLLFETYDYKEIFNSIHKNYDIDFQIEEMEYVDGDYKKVIHEYMEDNGIGNIEEIKKNNEKLIGLVEELRSKAKVKDKTICEILGIGKNRIYLVMNRSRQKEKE